MFWTWLVITALAGSILGTLGVHLWSNLLSLRGLKNPISEFQRPNEEGTFQAFWRLCWTVGFAGLHSLLWLFSILGYVAGAIGAPLVAFCGGLVSAVTLVAALLLPWESPLVSSSEVTPKLIWGALSMVVLAVTYGLSVWAGGTLMEKEEKE